jgi:methionyl aminopeptidase
MFEYIPRRNTVEISRMQQAASLLFTFFRTLRLETVANKPSAFLDQSVRRFLGRQGMQSALVGYRGYPAHSSVSVNATAAHGVPDGRAISRGDLFTLDVAASFGGWMTDTAWTYVMPGSPRRRIEEYQRGWRAFRELLGSITPGMNLAEVAAAAEDGAARADLAVIPPFTGHGIGRQLHEPPVIPFRRSPAESAESLERITLEAGMVLSIEPVYRSRSPRSEEVTSGEDGWSYRTSDGMPTYHFELTVAVLEEGVVVLQFGNVPAADLPKEPPFGNWAD